MLRQPSLLAFLLGACLTAVFPSAKAQTISVIAPASVSGFPGQTVSLPVTVNCTGISGPVSVVLSGLPSGITAAPLNLPSCGSGAVPITLSAHAAAELWPNFQTVLNFIDTETATVRAVAVAGSIRASTTFQLTVSINNAGYAPATGDVDLPVVRILTTGTIGETKANGSVSITSAHGTTAILPGTASSDGTAAFSIHGNSTALVSKLSYNMKLNTSSDLLAAMGVNCGYVNSSNAPTCDKSKTYILLANFFDKSLLRNSISMDLARSIRNGAPFLTAPANTPTPTNNATIVPWAPHMIPVELYLNGAYQGVYVLSEDIKIDSHRVNIKSMSASDITGAALTGGYLLEADYRTPFTDPTAAFSNLGFLIHLNVPIVVEDPDPPTAEQRSYIANDIANAQTALFATNFTDPNAGWRKYFDSTALVNYFIVNELLQNYDSGRMITSTYMFKDRNNGLIYMGPVWDFDISSGNTSGAGSGIAGADATDPTNHYMQNAAWWYRRLFTDPGFVQSVQQQWQALESSGELENWFGRISSAATSLNGAAGRDDQRWPKLGVPYYVSATTPDSYSEEVASLQGWLRIRAAIMEQQFGTPRPASTVTVTPPASASAEQPTTLTAQVTPSDASGTVYFLQNNAVVQSAAVSNGQAQITATLAGGSGTLRAVYTGDTAYLPSVSALTSISVAGKRNPSTLVLQQTSASSTGSSLAFSAHVVGNVTTYPPTGTVRVTAGGITSSGTLSAAGDTTITLSAAQLCGNPVLAQYSGDPHFLPATASQAVTGALAPTVTLTSPAGRVVTNQPFTINAAADSCGTSATSYNATLNLAATPAGLTVPATAVITAGVGSFSATATTPGTYTVTLGADAVGVTAVGTTVEAVAPTSPTITWSTVPPLYPNAAPFAIAATSDSSAALTYSVVSGPAAISGNVVTLNGTAGTVVVQATQPAQGFYAAGQATLNIQVQPFASADLAFVPAGVHTYGDAPFTIAATSKSTAPITYTVVSGPAVLSGTTIRLTGAGTVLLQAAQVASDQYSVAFTQLPVIVQPAKLTLTASDAARVYGAANPSFTGNLTGQVNGDDLTETFATTATTASAPGTYPITPTAVGASLANYTVSVQPGTLTISRATLAASADNVTRLYGAPNPEFTGKLTGQVNGDTGLTETFGTIATAASAPGTYAIVPTVAGAGLANYSVSVEPGTLTIARATLAVSADDMTRVYGAPNPAFTGKLTGQFTGDTGLTETFNTTATAASAPGTYAIVPTVAGSNTANYLITPRPGTLTVTRAAVNLLISGGNAAQVGAQTVPYTITAGPQFTGVPTGDVTLLVDGVPYTSATLANAQAVIPVQFTAGRHTVTAAYSGDMNFAATTAGATTTADVALPEFTFTAGASTLQYTASGANVAVQLTPKAGTFYAPVDLSVSGDVPSGYHVTLSPAQVSAGSAATTVQLALLPDQHSATRREVGSLALAALLLPAVAVRRRRYYGSLLILALAAALAGLTGCGDHPVSPSASAAPHQVTLTAQSAGVSHQVSLTLTSAK